jgi:hypothetical protein
MLNALAAFEGSIESARALSALYDFGTLQIRAPFSFDDLLRAQLVYAVSAFDKLMHDIVRIGMIESFNGTRFPTARFLKEPMPFETHLLITTATLPPAQYYFEQAVVRRHQHLSFQDPDKVAEALSLIWSSGSKWDDVAGKMGGTTGSELRKRLKAICDRRNKIVHEADVDPTSGARFPIVKADSEGVCDVLKACGRAIVNSM